MKFSHSFENNLKCLESSTKISTYKNVKMSHFQNTSYTEDSFIENWQLLLCLHHCHKLTLKHPNGISLLFTQFPLAQEQNIKFMVKYYFCVCLFLDRHSAGFWVLGEKLEQRRNGKAGLAAAGCKHQRRLSRKFSGLSMIKVTPNCLELARVRVHRDCMS